MFSGKIPQIYLYTGNTLRNVIFKYVSPHLGIKTRLVLAMSKNFGINYQLEEVSDKFLIYKRKLFLLKTTVEVVVIL